MIGKASQGLLRRVNILADKALLAAFVENTHAIEARHVQAALRDSEMTPMSQWGNRKQVGILGGMVLLAAILVGAVWFISQERGPTTGIAQSVAATPAVISAPPPPANPPAADVAVAAIPAPAGFFTIDATIPVAASAVTPVPVQRPPFPQLQDIEPGTLLQQRLEAARQMWNSAPRGAASIQLFYTESVQPERMEGFLQRARKLGVLDEIYLLPIQLHGGDAFRVLYGSYATSREARAVIPQLPPRYLEAFAPTMYLLDDSQDAP